MLFEGKKIPFSQQKKMQEILSIFEENTYGQSFSSLVSKGWEANICIAPTLQKSVTPTYSEKVSRRDIKRIKLLKALWK